jgi:hypothetical protein
MAHPLSNIRKDVEKNLSKARIEPEYSFIDDRLLGYRIVVYGNINRIAYYPNGMAFYTSCYVSTALFPTREKAIEYIPSSTYKEFNS